MPKQAGNRGRGNQGSGNRGSGNPASAGKGRGSKANQAAARAKVAEMRARETARKRRRNWLVGIGAAVVFIIAAVAITLAVTSSSGKSPSALGARRNSSSPRSPPSAR